MTPPEALPAAAGVTAGVEGEPRTIRLAPAARRRRLLFVVHGDRAGRADIERLLERLRGMGHPVDLAVTEAQGDAERLTRAGVQHRPGAVVAVGGDGTVNEVVNGLSGSMVPLGLLPAGTANDFARQVGIPDDLDAAMDVILRRRPTRVDTGALNGRRFLNVSTGGMGAEVTAETSAEAKELLGALAYAITGVRKLAHLEATPLHVTAPGYELACSALLFAVGNGRATGGGIPLTPRARYRDGLLDLCVIEPRALVSLAALLVKVRRGEHLGEAGVHYARLPEFTIRADREVSVNVDGEPTSGRTLAYRVRAGDLRIYLPPMRTATGVPRAGPR